MGGQVPKSYYLSNQAVLDPTNKKSLTVASGSKEHLEYLVSDSNSVLWYVFSIYKKFPALKSITKIDSIQFIL